MGGPGLLAIPESLTPQLAGLLRDNGIDVELCPFGVNDDPQHFLLHLACASGRVRLSVQRETNVNSRGPVIVIYAQRDAAELGEQISKILQAHGAWIPIQECRTSATSP